MKKIITCAIALFFAASLYAQQPENDAAKFPAASSFTNTKLSYKIINAADKTMVTIYTQMVN